MLDTPKPAKTIEELLESQLPATTIGAWDDTGNGEPRWLRWDNWDKDGQPWRN
jgi:hypothetical protein